jgi:MFS transporter, DHA1 family, multidrug resistance protein
MNLRFALVSVTFAAVVSDTMLHPFYPQFFATAFGVTDARHVGLYIGAACFTVMLAFPCWALVAKRVPALSLLVYTQLAAGLLSVLCAGADTLPTFWLVSLSMLAFKASYLLIYPYVMSLEHKDQHGGTIGLLSVIVHFGAILGSLLGGLVLEVLKSQQVFLVMAGGDFAQMLVCWYLSKHGGPVARGQAPVAARAEAQPAGALPVSFICKLGLIMLAFYFSAFLSRPFFSLYWESITALDSKVITGLMFAVPGVVALFLLWFDRRQGGPAHGAYNGIVPALLLGVCGLLLQASSEWAIVLIGRCVFGWALFRATVRLDLLLFRLSTPRSYATDFSKIHFFQNLGVLAASFAAGSLVAFHGLQIPFFAAALGFVLTAILYARLFGAGAQAAERPVAAS